MGKFNCNSLCLVNCATTSNGDDEFCYCNTCSENEGDCDAHDECQDCLVCGSNNCPVSLGFESEADCCYQPTETFYVDIFGTKTFEQSKTFCYSLGRKLFEPKSSEANIEVTQLVHNEGLSSGSTFWIGIHDIGNEGIFVYDSNSQAISYQNWNSGEPNDAGGEDCTEINVANGKWNDSPCNKQMSFVCEKPGKSYIHCNLKVKIQMLYQLFL